MTDTMTFYFNKPQRSIGVSRIVVDILAASRRVAMACAWFTDMDIAQAIVQSKAHDKIVVLSNADLGRGDSRAVNLLKDHAKLGSAFELETIGSNDFKEGIMHNKFIIADNVVWTGSYNFTYQARKNYETLIRIEGEAASDIFYGEINELTVECALWDGSSQFAISNGAFRCVRCENIKPISELGSGDDSCPSCKSCLSGGARHANP
jgi:phosphatidylserine/phosphatidylglycerophosphate/cardiolipin synthase-like enzyme